MSLTLILTRHAKSSWDDPLQSDHDRPLNKRGRKSAPAIGAWLTRNSWLPDEIISSTAARTRETFDRMGLRPNSTGFTHRLYHAGPHDMLCVLKGATGHCVLMLGHNPGIAAFANQIVRQAPNHTRFHDYPTCATTVIRFGVANWADVQWHSGEVLGFVIPRELLE